jgi:3-oxoadipate enol-lactonase
MDHHMTAPSQQQDIRANGISIRCKIDGREGAPWLVFSNSLMTNLSLWDDQVATFGGKFRILRYDQRGHGHTTLSSVPCSIELLVDDAIGLLDALSIQQVIFVGISMGSGTALRIAQRYPDRIQRMVMCAGNAATGPGNAQAWQERIDFARSKGMEAMVEPTIARWFHPDTLKADGEAVHRVRDMIRTTPLEGFVACAQALQEFDFQAGLPKMRLPALLLAGAADANATRSLSALQARIAGARYSVIPQAGHLANIEAPGGFNALMSDFLAAAI